MKTLIICAYPNTSSFNQSILQIALDTLNTQNHSVKLRNLYSEPFFQPILTNEEIDIQYSPNPTKLPSDILKEQALLSNCEALLFIYPVWWYTAPAILKGWFDRVWTPEFAFRLEPNGSKGLLNHKLAMVINTFGSGGKNPRINDIAKQGIMQTLKFCGIQKTIYHSVFSIHSNLSEKESKDKLSQTKNIIEETFAE